MEQLSGMFFTGRAHDAPCKQLGPQVLSLGPLKTRQMQILGRFKGRTSDCNRGRQLWHRPGPATPRHLQVSSRGVRFVSGDKRKLGKPMNFVLLNGESSASSSRYILLASAACPSCFRADFAMNCVKLYADSTLLPPIVC